MSTERATGIQSSGTTEDAQTETIEVSRAEFAELVERVDELEDDRDELQEENEKLRERVDDLEDDRERAEASRGHILEDVIDLEEQLEELDVSSTSEPQGESGETTGRHKDMTPIERVSRLDEEDTAIDMTPSIERAVEIFDHWREWSDKVPRGRVLKNDLKKLLRTATEEQLNWKQSYRAAEALEELSKGQIQFIDHDRHGKMLIEPQPTKSGGCHTSTATG